MTERNEGQKERKENDARAMHGQSGHNTYEQFLFILFSEDEVKYLQYVILCFS